MTTIPPEDELTEALTPLERLIEEASARSRKEDLPSPQLDALSYGLPAAAGRHSLTDYVTHLLQTIGLQQCALSKPLSQWQIPNDIFVEKTSNCLVFVHQQQQQHHHHPQQQQQQHDSSSNATATTHNAAESLFVCFPDDINFYFKNQLENVLKAAGFIFPVDLRVGYDTGSVDYGIFSTTWRGFTTTGADILSALLCKIGRNGRGAQISLPFVQLPPLPLSPTQLRSIPDFDEFIIEHAKISAAQQFALVQACRSLFLRHCILDEGGKGLVDAIVEQQAFERERTIRDIIPAFNPAFKVDESQEIICSFLPNHRLTRLFFLQFVECSFPFDDEQALRLFSCLHNKHARDQSTSSFALIFPECHLEALLRGQHPRAVQFLVDQFSAAFISGQTSMHWLCMDINSGAIRQLTADAVQAAIAQSNPETVAANVGRILEGPFPFRSAYNTNGNRQRLHDHAMEALADAVVSSAAAL